MHPKSRALSMSSLDAKSGRVSMHRATQRCSAVSFIFFASSNDFDIEPFSAS